jgi:menaquinone-dependent protoporphyrinogen oxidase
MSIDPTTRIASTNILVAFGTKHGSTQEVAEALATALRAEGHDVDLAPAGDVREISRYEAVVLGGALYMGKWHQDAVAFLKRHQEALRRVPLGVFALGPKTLDPADVASSRAQLERALDKFSDLTPATVAIFGGVVDPTKLRFPFTHLPASDARDWNAVSSWAHELAMLGAARADSEPTRFAPTALC